MAAMVAYNLMLALFPFALLLLFITGQLLQSADVQATILRDLQELFPSTEQDTLETHAGPGQDSSTEIGIVAIVAGLWIGASFWGAMDTAFCRIYHVECRGMVGAEALLADHARRRRRVPRRERRGPAVESLVVSGADDLPFGLDRAAWLVNALLIVSGPLVSFLILCLIYWAVPKGHLPWRGVWPGALFSRSRPASPTSSSPSTSSTSRGSATSGGSSRFVLVPLLWFYALSLGLLAGAVINALRFELHDTGTLRGMTADFQALETSGGRRPTRHELGRDHRLGPRRPALALQPGARGRRSSAHRRVGGEAPQPAVPSPEAPSRALGDAALRGRARGRRDRGGRAPGAEPRAGLRGTPARALAREGRRARGEEPLGPGPARGAATSRRSRQAFPHPSRRVRRMGRGTEAAADGGLLSPPAPPPGRAHGRRRARRRPLELRRRESPPAARRRLPPRPYRPREDEIDAEVRRDLDELGL